MKTHIQNIEHDRNKAAHVLLFAEDTSSILANSGPADDLDGVVSAPSLHLDRQKFYWPTREMHLRHAHTNGLHGELRRSHLERASACRYARAKRSITLMMA